MYHDELIKLYDKYWERLKIAPVAHTKIMSDFVILLDANGYKMAAETHEYVIVPCTAESETRSNNIAPHLLHDNITYVTNIPGYEKRHEAYLKQLHDYVSDCNDPIAKVIYQYVSTRDVLQDLSHVMNKAKINKPHGQINIIFSVYPSDDTVDLIWTNYYVNSLTKNGICMVTGQPDFIPRAYPSKIRGKTDMAKLFVDGSSIGYIASQKIIHTLQVLAGGNRKEIESVIAPQKITNWNI